MAKHFCHYEFNNDLNNTLERLLEGIVDVPLDELSSLRLSENDLSELEVNDDNAKFVTMIIPQ